MLNTDTKRVKKRCSLSRLSQMHVFWYFSTNMQIGHRRIGGLVIVYNYKSSRFRLLFSTIWNMIYINFIIIVL